MILAIAATARLLSVIRSVVADTLTDGRRDPRHRSAPQTRTAANRKSANQDCPRRRCHPHGSKQPPTM